MFTIFPVLLAAASVVAPGCTTGNWITKVGDQTIFQFKIDNAPGGVRAIWNRPENFESDGENFSAISGIVRRAARTARMDDGVLELSFDDPRPQATPDTFRFRCTKADHLDVTYVEARFEPFDFVKVPDGQSELGTFDPARSYVRVIDRPTNAEMTRIFDADQAARQNADIDWTIVGPADDKRRQRTQALLDSGALQSGDDFFTPPSSFSMATPRVTI